MIYAQLIYYEIQVFSNIFDTINLVELVFMFVDI